MAEVGCLKDGHFQNLEVNKLLVNNKDIRSRSTTSVVVAGGADLAITAVKNTLYIIDDAAGGERVLTLPALSSVNLGDFVSVHVSVALDDNDESYNITCSGTDKIYGNVTVGNAIAGSAAVANGAGLLNNVSHINVFDKAMVALSGDQDNEGVGTIGSTITLTAIEGSGTGSGPTTGAAAGIWWISGNLVTADPNSTGAAFIP